MLRSSKCFEQFGLGMYFAPRAPFPLLNFQRCFDNEVLLAFWLPNLLGATAACNFSAPISPDVSAPAVLASLLFHPPERQNIRKQCFATFLPFRAWIFFYLLIFLFWLFLFSDCSQHCCCICPYWIVGSLTFKLPSLISIISELYLNIPLSISFINWWYQEVV